MVKIQKSALRPSSWKGYIPIFFTLLVILALVLHVLDDLGDPMPSTHDERPMTPKEVHLVSADKISDGDAVAAADNGATCPYMSISQLSPEDQQPKQGKRHMVTPPEGGLKHLVCCQSTKGSFNVMVHENWAPLGAKRFLDMVSRGYFSSRVPLFRCLKNFICQFGLAGDPELGKLYRKSLKDDPQWLPKGKTNRQNKDGVKRFAHGYFAYAGGGDNSRSNQFIVSLADVGTLAGGSPWEVPWGQLVGKHSFETFSKVHTGYDEKGPSQGVLWKEGASERIAKEFPLMDYVTGCSIVDQE